MPVWLETTKISWLVGWGQQNHTNTNIPKKERILMTVCVRTNICIYLFVNYSYKCFLGVDKWGLFYLNGGILLNENSSKPLEVGRETQDYIALIADDQAASLLEQL